MAYQKTNWENSPSTKTPLNKTNLNKIEDGISNSVEKYAPSSGEGAIETITSIRSNNKSLQFQIGNVWYTAIHQPENGATYIPYVDSQGNISWSNTAGLSNPATKNIRGPQGKSLRYRGDYSSSQTYVDDNDYVDAVTYNNSLYIKRGSTQGAPGVSSNWSLAAKQGDIGPRGLTGATPVLKVGTVTSVPSNQSPKITISGTNENPVLNFEIPKGEQGIQGEPPKISVGVVETLPEGANAKVTISKDSVSPLINFGIPRGNTGATGDKGTSLRYQGNYTPTTQYVNDASFVDLVTHNSSLYIKTDMIQGEPGVNGGWALAARRGDPPVLTASSELLPAGQQPTVEITNNTVGADIAFGIPKGDKGDKGISFRFQGEYSSSKTYIDNSQFIDLVTYKGNLYIKTGSEQGEPGVKGWTIAAQKGDKGDRPVMKVKQTVTTAPGTNAAVTVENVGNDSNLTFNIPRGDKGDKGDTGITPKISIGKVVTLEPTEQAKVTISGTPEAPIMNMSLPRGSIPNFTVAATNTLETGTKANVSIDGTAFTFGIPKGDTGPRGNTGLTPQLSVGSVTSLGSEDDATVTIDGTAEAPKLHFGIPKGVIPKISVAATNTLQPGQSATASISSTGAITFGIPKGDAGPRGATGATPKLTAGTATSLDSSASPTVSITGTPEAPQINVGIPKGATPKLSVAATNTLAAGQNATASITPDGAITFGIPKGATGANGLKGDIGVTPKITVGTVSTLAPGQKATASISGSAESPILSLGIPKGDVPTLNVGDTITLAPGTNATVSISGTTMTFSIPRGATGAKGDTGNTPKIKIGTVSTLPNNSQATVTVGGTTEEPVLNFGLPRGATPNLSVGTVNTLTAGSRATVTIREGSSGPILDFGIPKGDQGVQGDAGVGLPSGGSAEQIITKDHYGNTMWGEAYPLVINDSYSSSIKTYSSSKINNLISSPIKTISIAPWEWQNGSYVILDSRITATSNQDILPPIYSESTKIQIEAIQSANLMDGGQETGRATIVCGGTVPTITITLRIIFRGEK